MKLRPTKVAVAQPEFRLFAEKQTAKFYEFKGGGIKIMSHTPRPNPHPQPITLMTKATSFSVQKNRQGRQKISESIILVG
jgi:hypothetical protein